MKPFIDYPFGGRRLIGSVSGSNCRHGYGREFMEKTGQTKCAYCGADFTADYETWLTMALDHVIPRSVCESFNLPPKWTEDCSNKVLACSSCSSFKNRYKPAKDVCAPKTLAGFYARRDKVFAERKAMIAQRHKEEKAFFKSRPWRTMKK